MTGHDDAAASPAYLLTFVGLALTCGVIVYIQNKGSQATETSDKFKAFQWKFLSVYFLASLSDWLQGPYVYALYASYGFSQKDIGVLFIAGFGASLCLGTFVAGLGDKYGRALNCKLFAVFYLASCVTKHFNNYGILMLGRILGGIATSILSSSFEAWMVSAHNKAGFSQEWLGGTFTLMTFGSGVAAILAGLLASTANSVAGPVAPFDLASLVLGAVLFLVTTQWEENVGSVTHGPASFQDTISGFKKALSVMASNQRVLMLGAIQSAFEGAMFIFVFMWTPALENAAKAAATAPGPLEGLSAVPHGLVFASFMACIMLGSRSIAPLLKAFRVEDTATAAFAVGVALLLVPVFVPASPMVLLAAFCGFEVVCGLYFPLAGIQRSEHVPEEVRSSLMNIFRVGLNAIVMAVLVNIDTFSTTSVFMLCSGCMAVATMAQAYLGTLVGVGTGNQRPTDDGEDSGSEEEEREPLVPSHGPAGDSPA